MIINLVVILNHSYFICLTTFIWRYVKAYRFKGEGEGEGERERERERERVSE